ncbi:glycosyltransferase family 2 protein [bacterium]|nr:glycosyltransferase family 2 protein [bacterium]
MRNSIKNNIPLPGAELSIVVPTFNEKENVVELVRRIDDSLRGISWEVIFVDDDSPDGTSDAVRNLGRQDIRVRCIQRIGRRGLSTACIEGMLGSSAPYLAVIDGDLQHDEKLLPQMLDILKNDEIDVVVGSRYVHGGGIGSWDKTRAGISQFATHLSRLVIKVDLTDPMSGFFMIRRDAFANAVRNTSGIGFKILLDLFASSPLPMRFKELPYQFRNRLAGESKLDSHAAWDYGMLILDKLIGKIIPVRFLAFCLVGGLGVLIHLLSLSVMYKVLNISFVSSQAIATIVAITFNFSLNNVLIYRDKRIRCWKWLRGWFSFTLACSVGAIANVGIASYLFQMETKWIIAALAGILVGAVWNYSVTHFYT